MSDKYAAKIQNLLNIAYIDAVAAEMMLKKYAESDDKEGLGHAYLGIAGFHAEQAIEKLLRAKLMSVSGREYPHETFPIGILVEDLEDKGVKVLDWIKDRADEISFWSACYEEGRRSEADVVSVEFALVEYEEQRKAFGF